ncbi:hypothetical protein [Winslowiella iniecta]|nr:hypothetical protein [Winslowiella iniecta]
MRPASDESGELSGLQPPLSHCFAAGSARSDAQYLVSGNLTRASE